MRTAVLLLASSAALATAQATYDEATGQWRCAKPNAAFCAGDSFGTDIIIRCNASGVGQPGRCSNNLSGQPPAGVKSALCYQPDALSGEAACVKNCIAYYDDGHAQLLPASICTPSNPELITSTIIADPFPTAEPTTTITFINPSQPAQPTTTITYVNPATPSTGFTTVINPPTHPRPTGTGNGGHTNGTACPSCPCFSCGSGGNGNGPSDAPRPPVNPTRVPGAEPGPSSRPTGLVTSGGSTNGIGAAAVLAMAAAYML